MTYDKNHRSRKSHPLRLVVFPDIGPHPIDTLVDDDGADAVFSRLAVATAQYLGHTSDNPKPYIQAVAAATALIEWAESGRVEFVVSADITRLLLETDYSIKVSDIKLPFPVFSIRWLGDPIIVTGSDGRGAVASCAVISRQRLPEIAGTPATDTLGLTIHMQREGTPVMCTLHIPLENPELELGTDTHSTGHSRSIIQLDNLIFNTLLYLQSPSADTIRVPARKPTNKQRRRGEDPGYTPYIYVGRSYDGKVARDDAATQHINKRFRVRGHWRNQAHGPGRTLRKYLWIEPHWRGPDTAEAIQKIYKVT